MTDDDADYRVCAGRGFRDGRRATVPLHAEALVPGSDAQNIDPDSYVASPVNCRKQYDSF